MYRLYRLLEQMNVPEHSSAHTDLKNTLDKAAQIFEQLKNIRHKRIAHTDWAIHTGPAPVPTLSYNLVEDALKVRQAVVARPRRARRRVAGGARWWVIEKYG